MDGYQRETSHWLLLQSSTVVSSFCLSQYAIGLSFVLIIRKCKLKLLAAYLQYLNHMWILHRACSFPVFQPVPLPPALPLPRHPLSVGTFLSLSPSTKPLATKFKRGPPGSNPTYFRFSPSKKTMNWRRSVFWEVTICHAHPPKNVTFCDRRLRGGAEVLCHLNQFGRPRDAWQPCRNFGFGSVPKWPWQHSFFGR